MLISKRLIIGSGLISLVAAQGRGLRSEVDQTFHNHDPRSPIEYVGQRVASRSGGGERHLHQPKLTRKAVQSGRGWSSDVGEDVEETWFPIHKRKAVNSHVPLAFSNDDQAVNAEGVRNGTSRVLVKSDDQYSPNDQNKGLGKGEGNHGSAAFASHRKHSPHGEHKHEKTVVERRGSPPRSQFITPLDIKGPSADDIRAEEGYQRSNMTRREGGVYQYVKRYSGATFFDHFNFFTAADPSGGMINYVSKDEARRSGLIGTKNGNAFMRIGQGNNGIQKSVRISTDDTFTTGLIVLDAYHMPTGCGVWPAFWTTPRDPSGGWPNGGEIDLVEGVHHFTRNMYSIHAPSWCSVPDTVQMLGKLAMPDKALARNCDPHKTSDQGCGVQSQRDGDYGDGFNHQGGGVHVLDWDASTGIHAYFFPRNKIPSDIQAGDPKPWTWGIPKASWPSTNCRPDDYFQEHVAVFTNTVCGTWAGDYNVWSNAMSGQSFTCKAYTGKNSCYDYMRSGADLSKAYWEIKSLTIYQKSRRL